MAIRQPIEDPFTPFDLPLSFARLCAPEHIGARAAEAKDEG
jgi:hypothetical protein